MIKRYWVIVSDIAENGISNISVRDVFDSQTEALQAFNKIVTRELVPLKAKLKYTHEARTEASFHSHGSDSDYKNNHIAVWVESVISRRKG